MHEARLWKYGSNRFLQWLFAVTPRWLWSPHGASRISGYATIRDAVRRDAEHSDRWELDLVGTTLLWWSGWSYYANELTRMDRFGRDPHDPVVYGRVTESADDRVVLSYWYFYIYNEAVIPHEGDWEAVWIELDAGHQPQWVVVSGHGLGSVRAWSDETLRKTKGGQPIVYVVRGTHAGYFEHKPRGHRRRLGKIIPLPTDRTVPDGEQDGCVAPDTRGVRVRPQVVRIPTDPDPDVMHEEFWWLSYRGRWGSAKLRLPIVSQMAVAPTGPAMKGEHKWDDPVRWADAVRRKSGLGGA